MKLLNHLKQLLQILLILWVCFFIYRLIGVLSLFNKYELGYSLIFFVIVSLLVLRITLIVVFNSKNEKISLLSLIIDSLFEEKYFVFCFLCWGFFGLMNMFTEPFWSLFTDIKQFELIQSRYVGIAKKNTITDYGGNTITYLSDKKLFSVSELGSIKLHMQLEGNFEEKCVVRRYLFWQTAFLDGYKFSTFKNDSSINYSGLAILNFLWYKFNEEVIISLRLTFLFFIFPVIMYFNGFNLKKMFKEIALGIHDFGES